MTDFDALHQVKEAVAGRFDPACLTDEELPYYYDLLDDALANPTPAEIAAMALATAGAGAVGVNDAGQLVRVREDGTQEVIPEA
jgi:hypothetical protein